MTAKNQCLNILRLLSCIVLTVVISTIITIWIALWLPVRLTVQLLAKIFRKDLTEMMDRESSIMALDKVFQRPEFNIYVYYTYDGVIPVERVQKTFHDRIFGPAKNDPRADGEFKRMRSSVKTFCGFFFWKLNHDFQVENHIRSYEDMVKEERASGAGGNLPLKPVYTEEDLKQIAAYLMSKSWKPDQSPWEFIVLNNFQSEPPLKKNTNEVATAYGAKVTGGQTVIMYGLHHTLGDGYSIFDFVSKFHNYKDGVTATPSRPRYGRLVAFRWTLFIPFKMFWDLVLYMYEKEWDFNEWVNRPRGPLFSSFMTTWTSDIPLDRIKRLKSSYKVSFVSVLQSVAAGAIGKMMRDAGVKVPYQVNGIMPLPVENHPLRFTNKMSLATTYLFTGEADPVRRLKMSHASFIKELQSMARIGMTKAFVMTAVAPIPALRKVLVLPRTTVAFTPFPSHEKSPELVPGIKLCRSFFTVGLIDCTTSVCMVNTLSACGNIVFTFSSRRHVINSREQMERFSQYIEDELYLLERAVEMKKLPLL